MGNSATISVVGRLQKKKRAGVIEIRAVIGKAINIHYRIQLWNTSIYSITKYGVSTLKISEAMRVKIQKFASKCTRDIAEAGTKDAKKPGKRVEERETNEAIGRRSRIPTTET